MDEEELGAGVQVIHKGRKKKKERKRKRKNGIRCHGSQRLDGVVKVQAVCQRRLEVPPDSGIVPKKVAWLWPLVTYYLPS